MQNTHSDNRLSRLIVFCVFLWVSLLLLSACQKSTSDISLSSDENAVVKPIKNADEFKNALASSHQKLVVIDFYADWCGPCRELAPRLEKVARMLEGNAQFYKVNIDEHRTLAMSNGVSGIPYVVFFKEGKKVHSLRGVWPMDSYVRTVKQFAFPTKSSSLKETPDGELIGGIRIIHRSPESEIDDIFVYRGESVRIIFKDLKSAYAVAIPNYRISQEGTQGQNLVVDFKADKTGVFPIFCNGDCPTGDGMEYGRIVVMPFTGDSKVLYKELAAEKARKMIVAREALILDVRTPNEYYDGHLPDAKLIPVQQLSQRISELKDHKQDKILVYCRSGNRSTVASEILIENGFKAIYHLKDGVIGWTKQGYSLIK